MKTGFNFAVELALAARGFLGFAVSSFACRFVAALLRARAAHFDVRRMAKRKLKVGDKVRVIGYRPGKYAPGVVDDMGTEELFQQLVGRRYTVRGFDEYGHVERPTPVDTVWIEPDLVSLVRRDMPPNHQLAPEAARQSCLHSWPHQRGTGGVEVFDLKGHPKAELAYAWSHIEGSKDERERFVAVLEIPPVGSAKRAVQVQIVKDVRKSKCNG